MKVSTVICALSFLILMACNGTYKDEVKDFIPGVYYRHYMDEYTNSYDTVEIKLVTNEGSDGYVVNKRARYQKMIDGQKTSFAYKTDQWFGSYEKDSKTLYIGKSGKRIYFDPKEGELKMGDMPYKKLN